MRNLTNKEHDFVAQYPTIINEIIERPLRKRITTKYEQLNNYFANISTSLTGYRVSNDNKLREIYTIVNSFKGENPTIIKEIVKSYYPKITKRDISIIVDTALSV